MEITFCELKDKEIINACDGKNLGNLSDLIFDSCTGKIVGISVPCNKSFLNFFKNNNEIFIPYNRICKIGQDVILVDIFLNNNNSHNCHTCNTQFEQKPNINIQSILNKVKE